MSALLISVPLVAAQEPKPTWLSETDQAKLDALRASGFEALFNLDYEKGRKDFKEIAVCFRNTGRPASLIMAASL